MDGTNPTPIRTTEDRHAGVVRVTVDYLGDLHCVARHGPSGATLETDAPIDNHGKGEAFSPTDLLGTALATCIGTILGILARHQGWDFTGMHLEVEKHMATSGIRRIARLPLDIHMPVDLDPKNRVQVELAAQSCPVYRSLRPDIEAPIRFHWPDGAVTEV